MNVIPAIDLKDGKCVRLLQGDFDRQTDYNRDPSAVADNYRSIGFEQLHLVDLNGAQSGSQENQPLVKYISKHTDLEIQLGGGIRDKVTLASWLHTGVKRCVIGSIAVDDPDTVKDWIRSFGSDRIVLALDARVDAEGIPWLATHGWTRTSEVSLWQCVDDYCTADVAHVLCTDISRDGAMTGPNIDLYRQFVERYPHVQLQASGGVRNVADLNALKSAGAAAAITGRALLDGRISPGEISSFLRDA